VGDNPVEVRILSAALCVFHSKPQSNQRFDCPSAVCNFSELRIDVSDGEGAAEIAHLQLLGPDGKVIQDWTGEE
jgi:hypothetical protein